jgi:hypothetical protein
MSQYFEILDLVICVLEFLPQSAGAKGNSKRVKRRTRKAERLRLKAKCVSMRQAENLPWRA